MDSPLGFIKMMNTSPLLLILSCHAQRLTLSIEGVGWNGILNILQPCTVDRVWVWWSYVLVLLILSSQAQFTVVNFHNERGRLKWFLTEEALNLVAWLVGMVFLMFGQFILPLQCANLQNVDLTCFSQLSANANAQWSIWVWKMSTEIVGIFSLEGLSWNCIIKV